jgi:hypothetical protein
MVVVLCKLRLGLHYVRHISAAGAGVRAQGGSEIRSHSNFESRWRLSHTQHNLTSGDNGDGNEVRGGGACMLPSVDVERERAAAMTIPRLPPEPTPNVKSACTLSPSPSFKKEEMK